MMPDHELATLEQLKSELGELRDRYPGLKDDGLFVLWFLRAYVTDDEQAAAGAVCGGPGDKGLDALLVDDRSQCVFIAQGKYRLRTAERSEDRAAVMQTAGLGDVLLGQDAAFDDFIAGADQRVAGLLRDARKCLLRRQYRLWLYHVTLGRCSSGLRQEAEHYVARTAPPDQCRLEVLDGKRLLSLLRDYLDGVAPPVPVLDLEVETGGGIQVKGVLERHDRGAGVESWVFPMRAVDVARLVESSGVRLFARNIRGFLGMNTPMNQSMVATLRTEPEHFFYYNNGITIVCDHAHKLSSRGREILRVGNPQIINGQQTARVLAGMAGAGPAATVLVKVIAVPRDEANGTDSFDELVSKIVAGTNWQNAIRQSDLMTNDRRQVEIERELRKRGYLYLRKRQSKQEARRAAGSQWRLMVSKEDLAVAVAACDLDPVRARAGKEHLFGDDLYSLVFPNSDIDYYLPRYWLMREVAVCSRGYAQRGYAKWLVLNFVWYKLSLALKAHSRAYWFSTVLQRPGTLLRTKLRQAIELAFREADRFYRANRGLGERALDPSTFYRNRLNLHKQFREHWDGAASATRQRQFGKLVDWVRDELNKYASGG